MHCCAAVRATCTPTLNGGEGGGGVDLEVTPFEVHVATILLPIVASNKPCSRFDKAPVTDGQTFFSRPENDTLRSCCQLPPRIVATISQHRTIRHSKFLHQGSSVFCGRSFNHEEVMFRDWPQVFCTRIPASFVVARLTTKRWCSGTLTNAGRGQFSTKVGG